LKTDPAETARLSDENTTGVLQFHCEAQLAIHGYLPGMSQPALLARVRVAGGRQTEPVCARLDDALKHFLPAWNPHDLPPGFQSQPALYRIVQAVSALLRHAGFPVFGAAGILSREEGSVSQLALPAIGMGHAATGEALDWVVGMANDALAEKPLDRWQTGLPNLLERMRRLAPIGMNSLRFLQAAHEAGMPWGRVVGNTFQFGWGARARWLDSSFTDLTPNISAHIARDKQATAMVLRRAGLPVPEHGLARNEQEALQLAQRLGYPVVVKPTDLDGGQGVHAGLKTPEALGKACTATAALGRPVLIEKHVEGNDYRVQVFQGEAYWAVLRRPAGVTGDGRQTVQALVAHENADPRRSASAALRKPIKLDEEARDWLLEQRLELTSVPAAGQFVRLHGAANIASGGTIEPVLERAHPDNLELAIRAARVLHLDLAGIDLLIPDIARSWRETGAAICEVNAQPQLSPHLPAWLLQRLVEGQGRISVVAVLGNASHAPWFSALQQAWPEKEQGWGLATPQGVWIDRQQVVTGPVDAFRGCLALLGDPQVEAALIVMGDDDFQQTGLPVDRFDALVLAGPIHGSHGQPDWERTIAVAQFMAKATASVFLDTGCAEWVAAESRLGAQDIRHCASENLASAITQHLEGPS